MPEFSYSPGIERRIAVGRLALASLSLLGMWLDPTEPPRHESYVGALLSAYILYAVVGAGLAWRSAVPPRRVVLIHSGEVLVMSAVLLASAGPGYFLWPLLVFAFLSGSLRWQWRGTLWTGAPLLAASIGGGVYRAHDAAAPIDLTVLAIRCATLAVIAILIGRLGALEARARRQMREIATPPDLHGRGVDDPIGPMLEWAGRITGAARVLLVWEEPEEPSLELALWDGHECRRMQERPDAFDPLVAAEVEPADFLHQPPAPCLVASPDGFRHWDGEPLHAELRARFSVGPVFAIRLTGEELAGRLLFLDKPHMTSDDLILGQILAHQLASRLSVSYLIRRLEEKAVLEERLRLARDLHDGAFHSLMGMALEVERLLRMPGLELADARQSLVQMQRNLQDEQRTLRMLIESLRASDPQPWKVDASLETRLEDLVSRIDRQRGLKMDVRATDLTDVPRSRWVDVCLIVHEALVNVARHAGASSCRLEIGVRDGQARIVVTDNGRGFPFKGHYDHDQLTMLMLGPATLRERATFLGGAMTIDSTAGGTCVEIRFPLKPPPGVAGGQSPRE